MKREINNKGLDSCKEKIEIKNYCSEELVRVHTQEGILSRSFSVAELNQPNKLHIQIRAYVDYWGGYAEHGRATIFGLENSGECVVKLTPIKSLIDIDPIIVNKCTHLINNPGFDINKSVFMTIAGPGWGQEKFLPRNGRYSIFWTMIESKECNKMMIDWLGNCEEIWCPTPVDYGRFIRLLGNAGKIKVMRLGYDENLYNPKVQPIKITQLNGRIVFGVLGSWNKRKGIKKIIRAFCRAFDQNDNVSLLLVSKFATRPYDGIKDGEEVKAIETEKWDINYEFKRYTEDLKNIPHVCIIDIPLHENVIPNVLARFDVLVGFSGGESTWLPGLQAMAMNKPVIQLKSECSGFIDYMNDENSYLCKDVKYILADDEYVKGTSEYYEGQEFAEGNEDELVEMMKRVYKGDRGELSKKNISESVKDRTWKICINKVISRLKEINR